MVHGVYNRHWLHKGATPQNAVTWAVAHRNQGNSRWLCRCIYTRLNKKMNGKKCDWLTEFPRYLWATAQVVPQAVPTWIVTSLHFIHIDPYEKFGWEVMGK